MGIKGKIFKGLIFDGVNSKDYGIYITGTGVYNAPTRDVEFIDIPGRNGSYALDNGRFHNIEVTYHAGTFARTAEEFAESVAAFRTALCSRKGYKVLTDEYNPDEFRYAAYASGLEVTTARHNTAGEFDIVFNCQPQRYLENGQIKTRIARGDTITNPTPFEAAPLFETEGYGAIEQNGEVIFTTYSSAIGETEVPAGIINLKSFTGSIGKTGTIEYKDIDTSFVLTGDTMTISGVNVRIYFWTENHKYVNSTTVTQKFTDSQYLSGKAYVGEDDGDQYYAAFYCVDCTLKGVNMVCGTPLEFEDHGAFGEITYTNEDGTKYTDLFSTWIQVEYDGDKSLRVQVTVSTQSNRDPIDYQPDYTIRSTGKIIADSSYQADTQWIDCETGESYFIHEGSIMNANKYVNFAKADLPRLKPGESTYDFEKTVRLLRIIPRWWVV